MLSDLRLAVRQLLKSPLFTLISLLTLALGIGLNTSMFSVANAYYLRPLPYPDAERLVRIHRTSPQSQEWPHSPGALTAYAARNQTFDALAAYSKRAANFAEPGKPAEALGELTVGRHFFDAVRVAPFAGRLFADDEYRKGGASAVLLTNGFWKSRFASDPSLVGSVLRIDGAPCLVVGILPESFEAPLLWGAVEIVRPLSFSLSSEQDLSMNWLNAVGLLKRDVSPQTAETNLRGILASLQAENPGLGRQDGLRLAPLATSNISSFNDALTLMICGLSFFVLVIACANLANLQLVRTLSRSREFSVRAALGGSRFLLMRPLLFECLVLSLGGGVLGILLSLQTNQLLNRFLLSANRGLKADIDFRVLAFAAGLSLLSGLVFSLAPAWSASKRSPAESLKQGARGSSASSHRRLKQALVAGEIALAIVLLAGALFFARGINSFLRRDTGFSGDKVLAASFSLSGSRYGTTEQLQLFYRKTLERLSSIPGVKRAALSSSLPIFSYNNSSNFAAEGRQLPPKGGEPLAFQVIIGGDYFGTLGIPLKEGSLFPQEGADNGREIIVINEAMAKRFWPGESAVGKRIVDPDGTNPREIVGVVGDVSFAANLGGVDTANQVYLPLRRNSLNYVHLSLLCEQAPESLERALRSAMAEVDPDLALCNVSGIRTTVESSLRSTRAIDAIMGFSALLGLLLALLGIYGIVANLVALRTREIGIRLALGASPVGVVLEILREGAFTSLVGLLLGTCGSALLALLFLKAFPNLPLDGWTTLAFLLPTVAVASLVATWIPSRRAAGIDPCVALRSE